MGRWYKLYPINTINIKTKHLAILLGFSIGLTFVLNIIGVAYGMDISSKYFWAYSSPWMLLSSSLILVIFSRLKVDNNKIITFFATGSLSVYLVHESSLISSFVYVRPLRYLQSLINNDIVYILIMLLYALLLFLIVASIDVIRQKLQDFTLNLLEKNKYYNIVCVEVKKVFQ